MYYEERILNGRIQYRTSPYDPWSDFDLEQLHHRVIEYDNEITAVRKKHDRILAMVEDDPDFSRSQLLDELRREK